MERHINDGGEFHDFYTQRTNGKLSDTTSGFKALVLKAVGPFLKKKSVTVVPFAIAGTSSNPSFALDFTEKRRVSSLPAPGPWVTESFANTTSDVGEIARWGRVPVAMILFYPTFRRAVQ